MTDRLAEIKEKWRFAFDLPRSALWGESDVKWMLAEIERLRDDNAMLEAAWRDAGDRGLADTQVIARLKGLLYKVRLCDEPSLPDKLIVAIDEVLHDPDLP
jgi:hypothetical protein